jgi:hypothetical protein
VSAFGKRAELSPSQPPFAGMIDPDVTDAYDVTALLLAVYPELH